MNIEKDFKLFARDFGLSESKVDGYMQPKNSIIEPYILEERNLNVATMSVFSRLFYDRIVFLASDVTSDSANVVKAQLLYLNSVDDSDVKFFIDTCGGSINGGLSIIDIMNYITPDVQTFNMGLAASMGSVLLSAGTRGKRYALPHSEILIHQPLGGLGGHTQESDFAIAYEQIKKSKDTLYRILSENTGKSVEEITKDADRDHWLTAEESLPGVYGEYGLVDKIMTKKNND